MIYRKFLPPEGGVRKTLAMSFLSTPRLRVWCAQVRVAGVVSGRVWDPLCVIGLMSLNWWQSWSYDFLSLPECSPLNRKWVFAFLHHPEKYMIIIPASAPHTRYQQDIHPPTYPPQHPCLPTSPNCCGWDQKSLWLKDMRTCLNLWNGVHVW